MSIDASQLRKRFWEEDRKNNGGQMYKAYMEISNTIANRNAETEALISEKLSRLLKHAASTTEYYAEYAKTCSLSNFPVINRQIVIDNRSKMFSSTFAGQKLHEMYTSGSTGIPFVIQQDMGKRLRVIAEIKAMNDIAGYASHEKMLYIVSAIRNTKSIPLKQQQEENIWRIPVTVNDDETMQKLVDFLINEKPVAIHAWCHNLMALADYIKKKKISQDCFHVRTIITGSEMVPAKLRLDLQEIFGPECRVHVKYSNEEMGIFGMDTGIDTPYILNVSDYYFEILKMDSNEPCKMGEMGRIVITDLYNYALPLIRYDTGDIGALGENGNAWPQLTTLHGKRRDLIFSTKGVSISGPTIAKVFENTTNVKQYQLIQEAEKEYRLKIVPDNNQPSDNNIFLDVLYDMLGADAEIHLEFIDEIPITASQKRRYTINLYRTQ